MAFGLILVSIIGAMMTTVNPASAATISILWEASPSPDVAGYVIYYGNKSGDYTKHIYTGKETRFKFQPVPGADYFFAVTALADTGVESLPSNEVAYSAPPLVQVEPGLFNGLFAVSPSPQIVASLTLKKTTRSFSGIVTLNGQPYRFSGKPDASGAINAVIKRRGLNSLVLALDAIGNENHQMVGTLTDGDITMQLIADRSNFNARTNVAPFAGNYTVAVVGILGESLTPGGIGFGALRVLPNGRATVRGTLGDGKTFVNSSYISSQGVWPFYISPYGKAGGSISGWLQIETNGTDSIHGDLTWIKPAVPKDKFYPAGFSNSVALIGSTYHSSTGVSHSILGFTNGTITVSGADLSSGFVKDVILSTTKIAPAVVGGDRLSVRIVKATGLFSGTIRIPGITVPLAFRGSLLQNQNAGYGLFLRANQAGEVRLESAP